MSVAERCRHCDKPIVQRGRVFGRWVHAYGLAVCRGVADEYGRAYFAEPK